MPPRIWSITRREGQHLYIFAVFQLPLSFILFHLSLCYSYLIPSVLSLGVMMRMRWVTVATVWLQISVRENYFCKKWFFLEPYKPRCCSDRETYTTVYVIYYYILYYYIYYYIFYYIYYYYIIIYIFLYIYVIYYKHILLRNGTALWIIIICFHTSALKKKAIKCWNTRENTAEN